MENLNEIKKLRQNANSIYELFKVKIPKWSTDPRHYDKTGWGFNEDSRFNACKPASVAFSSYMGTYGYSGCSSQCSMDDKLFQEYLVKYLNQNKESVMLGIAKLLEEQAKSLKDKAEAELTAQMDKLKELDAV